jgi:hypothetical protein
LLIWDNVIAAFLLGPALAQIPGMMESYSKLWETVGDLFAAGILVWVYSKVKVSFNAGIGGGLTYGLYAGILMNFPGWLWMTVYAGWPYAATWVIVIVSTLITVVSGILIGLVYGRVGIAKAT